MSLIIVVKFTLCSFLLGRISAKNDSSEIFLTDIISDKKKYDEHRITDLFNNDCDLVFSDIED